MVIDTQLMVFDGPGSPFRAVEREFNTDELGPGEVLVQIDLATVCGSDTHTVAGKRKEATPCVLGHEAVGRVTARHEQSSLTLGERVTWTIADSCGRCPASIRS
jgi:D-arabinose 1-dehydrogenase-like Zn-dependent alcohol dehydrogenase